jgi:hypothetical protein
MEVVRVQRQHPQIPDGEQSRAGQYFFVVRANRNAKDFKALVRRCEFLKPAFRLRQGYGGLLSHISPEPRAVEARSGI